MSYLYHIATSCVLCYVLADQVFMYICIPISSEYAAPVAQLLDAHQPPASFDLVLVVVPLCPFHDLCQLAAEVAAEAAVEAAPGLRFRSACWVHHVPDPVFWILCCFVEPLLLKQRDSGFFAWCCAWVLC